MSVSNRTKVLRVVTSSECVDWHIGKSLKYLAREFDVTVVGNNVSKYAKQFPDVSWVDILINRDVNLFYDLWALFRLYGVCLRIRPTIVHSIMPKAGLLSALAAKLAGVPVRVHTFTGQVWDTKHGFFRWGLQLIDRLIVFLNTTCLTDSPSQSIHLLENGISDRGKPIRVLGKGSLIGVDLERFDRQKILTNSTVNRLSLGLASEHFVVIYLARKSKDKGALDMLRGFARARQRSPDLRLLFVGPDESHGEIERLRLEDPNIFCGVVEIGAVSRHEEFLAVGDVLCMPSHREGFGSVVIDAGALGLPCVGSRIPGLVDSVHEGRTGLLFQVGDVDALSDCLLKLKEDRNFLRALGVHAEERVRKDFSTEVLYQHLRLFYRQELSSSRFR